MTLLASAGLMSLAHAAVTLAQAPVTASTQPARQSSRATSYDAAFFNQYAPRTALDIVQRLPGFTLDLGNTQAATGQDVRGFAGTAGNVVINGQRPSTKSETLDAYLSRIAASRVKRVEVGPGDLYGADYSSKTQVANLILVEGGSGLTGNATVTAIRHHTGNVVATGNASVSLNRGPSTFNIAADTNRTGQFERGFDTVTDLTTGDLIEFRRKFNNIRNTSPSISASWSLDKGPTNSANLNVRYHYDHFLLHQTNHVIPTGGAEHDDRLVESYPTKIFEIGGDVTRPLAGGAIKFVGLASRQSRHTLDEYDAGDLGPTQIVGGFQQLSASQRNETLGRLSWTKAGLFGFNTEIGAETAWNTLTDNLDLFAFDQNGGKSRIDLPIGHATVTELRGEAYVNASRPLSKSLRLDLGLNYEMSKLKVSGDARADRKLKFLKPSVTLDWQLGGWHTQFIVRRTVAQLDFFDFISVADLAANQVSGGNANLLPQRSWEGRLSAEHALFGAGKLRLELGYNLISKLQDRILSSSGFDAPGNLGTGRQMFADLTLDAPLDRYWKGLRVKLHGNIQNTRVKDTVSGQERDFSGFFPRWEWDADVRRDAGRFAYGFTLSDNRRTTFFRADRFDTRYNLGFPYTTAFVEFRPSARQTLALNFDDFADSAAARDFLIFTPNRTASQPSLLEHRFRNSHVRVGLTFKQTLGGGGLAKQAPRS